MEANPRSPRDLFDGKEHCEIPAFQRPYVWNEEDQWSPGLWGNDQNLWMCFGWGVPSRSIDPQLSPL